MFYSVDKSEDLSPGHRISDNSERLLFLLKDLVNLAAFLPKANKQSLCTWWLLLFSLKSCQTQPHGLQHTRLPCPSLYPGVCSNSHPLSWLEMLSNHLILCRPLLLLPSVFPSISVFSNKSALCISWPKYWSFSFSISPYNELVQFSSVAQPCPTLQPHEPQHARPPCPSPAPGACSNSCSLSRWCHPTISSSVAPSSSCNWVVSCANGVRCRARSAWEPQ